MSEHVKLNTAQGSTGAYERKVFTPCHACRILQHSTMISASYQGFERFDRLTHTCITPCLALHSQVLKTPNSTASISELPPALTWTHSPSMSLGLLRSRQMQDKEFNLLSLSRTKSLKINALNIYYSTKGQKIAKMLIETLANSQLSTSMASTMHAGDFASCPANAPVDVTTAEPFAT